MASAGDEKGKKVPVLRTNNSLIQDEFDSIRSRFDEEMRLIDQEMARFKSQMSMTPISELLANSRKGWHQDFVGRLATTAEAATASSSRTKTTKTRTTKTTSSTNKTINKHIAEDRSQQQQQQQHLEVSEGAAKSMVKSDQDSTSSRVDQPEQVNKTDSELAHEGSGQEPDSGSAVDQAPCLDSPLIVNDSRVAGGKMLRLRFDVSSYEPDQIVVATIENRLQVYAKRNEVSANTSLFSEYNREFLLPVGTDPDSIKSTLSADGVLTIEAPLAARK